MGGLEFYTFEDELWCKTDDGENFVVDETRKELVSYIINNVRERYPEAYKALTKHYQKSAMNVSWYQFLMARRFCKCNFGCLDATTKDVDDIRRDGVFHFEKVHCPLRGECLLEGIVCNPKFDGTLSRQEQRVMKLLYEGRTKDEISSELYISPGTVKLHIKSAYLKLGVHSEAEFVRYAKEHNLFQTD